MRAFGAAMAIIWAVIAADAGAQTLATWSDPSGHFTIQRPGNWPVDRMGDSSPAIEHYAAGLADAECSIYSIERAGSAATSPGAVQRGYGAPFTREQWVQVTQSVGRLFQPPTDIQSMSVDTSRFWPIQRATIMSAGTPIEAGLQARPGREFWMFCQSFDNRNRADLFARIIASLTTPRDAALQAEAEAAAAATPPPAPTPE